MRVKVLIIYVHFPPFFLFARKLLLQHLPVQIQQPPYKKCTVIVYNHGTSLILYFFFFSKPWQVVEQAFVEAIASLAFGDICGPFL